MHYCWFTAKLSIQHSVLRFTAPPYTELQCVLYSCSSSCRTAPSVRVDRTRHTRMHGHAYRNTRTQAINQTAISTNSPSRTCRHTLAEAMVGTEWWALRATSQGPHEKPLCLGGTEERGQQVHQPDQGWPPAHTHTQTAR